MELIYCVENEVKLRHRHSHSKQDSWICRTLADTG